MVIFLLGEDRAYLSWLAHHRNGFVLDWLRKPTRKTPVVHRADCEQVRISTTKNSHWTTGRRIKACSLDREELLAWARVESNTEPDMCDACQPANDTSAAAMSDDRHLTKLGKEIVDYVVEAAVIHLDRHDSSYHMTVADVAQYLDKTPAQLSPALIRLVTDGYLRVSDSTQGATSLRDDCHVLPTADAMRTLPAFEKVHKRKVEAELDTLTDDE